MIVLWMTLKSFFHFYIFFLLSDSLVPVKTVQLGEPVTLTCLSSKAIYWYKQNIGETLKLILALYKNTPPEYGPEFSNSRFNVNNDKNFSNLMILKTIQEDEGIYHCGITEWINAEWSGTYLRFICFYFPEQTTQSISIQMTLLVFLSISVIGNVFLIFYQRLWKPYKGKCYRSYSLS
uniref:Immunoglobulin domain-containing protein n=1 Tax=Astatotilapia calliptera TaxID=8154 RepID=A0A3P8NIX8_ASTCA